MFSINLISLKVCLYSKECMHAYIQQRIFQRFSHSVLILTWTTASLTFSSCEWFRIMYEPMFKIFVCNKDTCSLCPHLVISSAPKTVVRNVQAKETTEKTI